MSQDSNQKTWLDRLVDPALRNKINVRKFNAALNTINSIVKVMFFSLVYHPHVQQKPSTRSSIYRYYF